MPWRPRPRAALALGLLCAILLMAAAGFFRVQLAQSLSQPVHTAATRDTSTCARVSRDRWSALPGVEYTGLLEVELPAAAEGAIVLLIADHVPLDVEAETWSGVPWPIERRRLRVGPGLDVPPEFWLELGTPWSMPGRVVRATLDGPPMGSRRLRVHLGRRAPRVLARLTGYADDVRVPVCAARIAVDDAFASRSELHIAPSSSEYFASGWYGEEPASAIDGRVRWMGEHGAILVPSARDAAVRVRLRALAALTGEGDDATMLSLRVNDVFDATRLPMSEGSAEYEWLIPETAWVAGTNELLFNVSRTMQPSDRGGRVPRTLGLALRQLDLTLVESEEQSGRHENTKR